MLQLAMFSRILVRSACAIRSVKHIHPDIYIELLEVTTQKSVQKQQTRRVFRKSMKNAWLMRPCDQLLTCIWDIARFPFHSSVADTIPDRNTANTKYEKLLKCTVYRRQVWCRHANAKLRGCALQRSV